jgi:sugar-specific transcriptional regulator TrmB
VSDNPHTPLLERLLVAETTIKKMLKDFGLTDTESEVYLFLSKNGVSKGTQIAKQTKKDKAQIYHALKGLVVKGLAESTLESPVRYTAIAFENIVESAIKAKQEEAVKIQNTKQELLNYWKNLSKHHLELPIEKFAVIEGRPKVYARITQMLKDAKKQIVTITTVPNLIRAEQFGLYDVASKNPLKSQIQFRFITDFSDQDVKSTQRILNKMSKRGFNFKGKTPQLGQSLFPQMVIRDGEEAAFFINPNGQEITGDIRDDICLWTNCRSLVQAFRIVFEEYWHDSKDFQEDIIETEKPSGEPMLIFDFNKAQRLYFEILKNAQKDILAITSSIGLVEFCNSLQNIPRKKNVPIRIMAPIESGTINFAQNQPDSIEIRHFPKSNLETTIVDGKYVFQFNISKDKKGNVDTNQLGEKYFTGVYYSDDMKYVDRAKSLLEVFWKKASAPLPPILEGINQSNVSSFTETEDPLIQTNRKIEGTIIIDSGYKTPITEKEILEKVINQTSTSTTSNREIAKTYGSNAQAIIHAPSEFGLPTLLFHILHIDKRSTFGAEDVLAIHFLLNTPIGETFVPVALLTDNPKTVDFWTRFLGGSPAAQNIQLLAEDKLEIAVHGNMLFAAWTAPVSIPPYTIPPSAILIEGSGNIKPSTFTIKAPSGFKMKTEYNGCDGFVTYFHPSSKYSGPGTDGLLGRDAIMEFYPPKK